MRQPRTMTPKTYASKYIVAHKRSGCFTAEYKAVLKTMWVDDRKALTEEEFRIIWLGAGHYSGVPSDTRG